MSPKCVLWKFLPPVPIELSVSKPQELSNKVHAGVEEEVEEEEPEHVVG